MALKQRKWKAVSGTTKRKMRRRKGKRLVQRSISNLQARRIRVYTTYYRLLKKRGDNITLAEVKRLPLRAVLAAVKRLQKVTASGQSSSKGSGGNKKRKSAKRKAAHHKVAPLVRPQPPNPQRPIMNQVIHAFPQVSGFQTTQDSSPPAEFNNPAPVMETTPPVTNEDLNAPAPLSTEIKSDSQETERVNAIFVDNASSTFDPGLWNMVVEQLPQDYKVPDPDFLQSLVAAQQEVQQPVQWTNTPADDDYKPDPNAVNWAEFEVQENHEQIPATETTDTQPDGVQEQQPTHIQVEQPQQAETNSLENEA